MREAENMIGKTVLITGGTGGIGRATAEGLARLGAKLILVGRDQIRGETAVEELRAITGNRQIEFLAADLSSQVALRQLAQTVLDRYDRLDVLLNNVGGLYAERWETLDGIEATLAMTHLAPFLLTQLLLPLLKKSAPARIINVSSGGHRLAKLDLNDLQAKSWYRGLDIYNRAKLVNLLTTYEQARRLNGTGVTINAADPGGAQTEMTKAMTPQMVPVFMKVLWPVFRLLQSSFLKDTSQAAQSSIYGASSAQMEGINGQYINSDRKIVKSSKASYDEAAGRRLWQFSEQLTGLTADQPARV